MSESQTELIHRVLEGGVAAQHPAQVVPDALVGPATAQESNALQQAIVAVACWSLNDIRFEFDSSFVLPQAANELPHLAFLRRLHPDAPLSVFGHADPVGSDEYNKTLSGRRAQAIYGLLVRDASLWEDLAAHPFGGDQWGVKMTQTMLEAVGFSPGAIDGQQGPETTEALRQFQNEQGLTPDGVAGPQTRSSLFLAYMDVLCRDETDQPFQFAPADFLAQGSDGGGKGDYQGCGEFNPLLMFSQEENARFEQADDKTARNRENAPNRRVIVFLFRPGSRSDPGRWPCPRVKEGTAACRKRFFVDAPARRTFQAQRRVFEQTHDTFACRFYQRIAGRSPCEGILASTLRVMVHNRYGVPRPGIEVEVLYNTGEIATATTDGNGLLVVPIKGTHETARIRYNITDTDPIEVHDKEFFIDLKSIESDEGVRRRLYNLGYLLESTEKALRNGLLSFQATYGLEETGQADAPTRDKLVSVHDGPESLVPEVDLPEGPLDDSDLLAGGYPP